MLNCIYSRCIFSLFSLAFSYVNVGEGECLAYLLGSISIEETPVCC